MKRIPFSTSVIIILATVPVVIFAYYYYKNFYYKDDSSSPRKQNITLTSDSPSSTISPQINSEEEQNLENIEISGEVVSDFPQPVGYKNSKVIIVEKHGADGVNPEDGILVKERFSIYITPETAIFDENKRKINLTSIQKGQSVTVVATSAEGGYEAIEVNILNKNSSEVQKTKTNLFS